MPNIPQYNSGLATEGLRPSDLGADAWAQEGRRVGQFYHQIGEEAKSTIDDLQAHDDLQTSIAMTDKSNQVDAQLAQEYATQRANPNFNLEDWKAHVAEAYGSIGDTKEQGFLGGVLGQSDKIQAHAVNLRNQGVAYWTKQAINDQMTIDGKKAVQAGTDAENATIKTLTDDPSQLGSQLPLLTSKLTTLYSSARVPASALAEEKARVQSTVAQGTLDGWLHKAAASNGDPSTISAISQIVHNKDGDLYKLATQKQLDEFDKSLAETGKAAAVQFRQQAKEDFDQKASNLIGNYIQPDGSLRVPPGAGVALRQLSQHPGATPGEIKSIGEMNASIIREQEKGTKIVSDPQTYQLFGDKMAQGNLSVQEISDARSHGLLSNADTSYFMRRAINPADPAKKDAEKQFNAWANSQKPAFTRGSGLLGLPDPQGAAKFNQFYQDAHARFEQLYDTKGDWQGSLDAKKPNYLGSIAPQYMHSIKGAAPPTLVVKGKKFIGQYGNTAQWNDFNNPKYWQKQ